MNTENTRSKPVVFIAGPMTGKPDFNRPVFNEQARCIEQKGFTVLNPAVLPDGLEHHQYLAITLVMLEQADAIYLLEGWEKSVGAKAEAIRARELNLMFVGQSWELLWSAALLRPVPARPDLPKSGVFVPGGIMYRPVKPGIHDYGHHQTDPMGPRCY